MISADEPQIFQKLAEWEHKEGQLPELIRYYRELLQMQSEAKSCMTVRKPGLTNDFIHHRLSKGIPLLLFGDFSPDWHQVQTLFKQVVTWSGKDSIESSTEDESLRKISLNISLLTRIIEAWYRGHSLKGIAEAEMIDCLLINSIIAATLKPFLETLTQLLLPEVDQKLWRHRYCPICGGKPDLTYLDQETGARWLLCSRCDAEWLFLRLECPFCGTQNQNDLVYFTDDEERYGCRLYVCERCHAYIKAIDLRHAGSGVILQLERILTLGLDRQALEKGYKPGWLQGDGLGFDWH